MLKLIRPFTRFRCAGYLSSRFLETDTSPPLVEENQFKRSPLPLITSREMPYKSRYMDSRQAWLCNMDTIEEEKLGLLDLHPSVFAVMPRTDILHRNIDWQEKLHFIDFKTDPTPNEMPGGGRKPWPQKGTGRARHGSIRSPIFKKGGKVHGKRGPKTMFYMLSLHFRVLGLTTALSCKFAQDDLYIVDSLEIPTDDRKYIEDLIETRRWGNSVLFLNDTDIMPKNITLATEKIDNIALMPFYGLNVYSMLKYDTLVMTLESLNRIEDRLVFNLNRSDHHRAKFNKRYPQYVLQNST